MTAERIALSLPTMERRLAAHTPARPLSLGLKRSAVACVLRFDRAAPEVLLMKRAQRKGDRWSGQISFPGGREQADDFDLRATAVRETREEVGVNLHTHARMIGQLDTIRAVAKGGVRPLTITPYVFVQTRTLEVALGDEAVDSFWFPLEQAASGDLTDEYRYEFGPVPMIMPCWRYNGHQVWGLTYRMLNHLLDVTAV